MFTVSNVEILSRMISYNCKLVNKVNTDDYFWEKLTMEYNIWNEDRFEICF